MMRTMTPSEAKERAAKIEAEIAEDLSYLNMTKHEVKFCSDLAFAVAATTALARVMHLSSDETVSLVASTIALFMRKRNIGDLVNETETH